MTEEQANKIISLLKDISSHLSIISRNSEDISAIDLNTENAVEALQKIKSNTE